MRSIWIRNVSADLGHVRDLVAQAVSTLRSWGFGAGRVSAWELAITELVTNVCRHAYRDTRPGPLQLRLELDEALRISIRDEGAPFDPSAVPDPPDPDPRDPDTWPEGGMGLHLVRSAGDTLTYRCDGSRQHLRTGSYPLNIGVRFGHKKREMLQLNQR